MSLNNLKQEDLEIMSNTDIAYHILKEHNAMTTANLFKEICNLLELSDDEYANTIGDFYTALTTDKRFVLLDTNEWDLRDKHSVKIVMEEEEEEEEETTDEVEESADEDDIDEEMLDDDLDDDDLDDLSIVNDEELDEE